MYTLENMLDKMLTKPEYESTIPRLIHQTYPSETLPNLLYHNVMQIQKDNPGWEYRLYNDRDIEIFIFTEYGNGVLSYYLRINPEYGAARADLFRYLVIYKLGGVYLDIKSRFLRPIDDVLRRDEQYIISRWSNGDGERYEGYGLHPELSDYPGGEIQQWHVIAAPGHPFLRAMILSVLKMIHEYSPWRTGVGKSGVLRLTGPIAYTQTITPLLNENLCRIINDERELALDYSVMAGEAHKTLFTSHYTARDVSVVRLHGFAAWSAVVYVVCRRIKRLVKRTVFDKWHTL